MSAWGRVHRGVAGVCVAVLAGTLAVTGPATAVPPERRSADEPTEEERREHGLELMPEVPAEDPIPVLADTTAPGRRTRPMPSVRAATPDWPEPTSQQVELAGSGAGDAVGPVSVELTDAGTTPQLETSPGDLVPATESAVTAETPSAASAAPSTEVPPATGVSEESPVDTVAPEADEVPAVGVEVLDQAATDALGITGLLLELDPVDLPGDATVEVTVDYSDFASAMGGDWASRLVLMSMPDCARTTPGRAECRVGTAMATRNDSDAGTLTATVPTSSMGVMAVAAATAGPNGNWAATPLSPSSTWQVSPQTGAFTWSYPMQAPAVPGGLAPSLSLGYSSGGVDGRVSSTNNQTTWIGEGWDMTVGGYIERRYVSCSEDMAGGTNASRKTYDLCWSSDNATLVLNGRALELVKDKTTGQWRAVNDDATRIERFTGAANGDNDGEWWKVTTTDGTQYTFGRERRDSSTTNLGSTWTVPVFGNHTGEPCYNASFASGYCPQAWRWNLEYVLDTNDNTMTFFYKEEGNRYGRNLNTGVSDYVRGGYLDHIDYGQRKGAETSAATARVIFTVAERCLPVAGVIDCAETSLTSTNAKYWPDVPFDQICASTATTCPSRVSPSFFTRKRLTAVTTQVLSGASTYREVDRWTLTHTYPDAGGSGQALWLSTISRRGTDAGGATITMPNVTFHGIQLANRVDQVGDIGAAMYRYRIDSITTDTGATIAVNYTPKDCTPGDVPASPDANTRRCFPVSWTPQGYTAPIFEYFHKYLVSSVVVDGQAGDSPAQETSYSYVGAPAWRYDDSPLVPVAQRTWGDFRGYATVEVLTGAAGEQSRVRHDYFRGMHRDKLAAGGTRTVTVDGRLDEDWLNGFEWQTTTFDGQNVVSGIHTIPWESTAQATGADGTVARYVRPGAAASWITGTALPGGERRTRVWNTYDSYGMITQVYDEGDIAVTGDERCARTTYARTDTSTAYLVDRASRKETVGVACTATPTFPQDAISDTRYLYDALAFGASPTRGRLTSTQEVKSYFGNTPTYLTVSSSTYDSYGRPLSQTDALGRVTSTAYTQTNGLLTKTVVTTPDPDGSGPKAAFATTSVYEPARRLVTSVTDANGKVTSGTYDALGRLTAVWQPGRLQGSKTANTTYAYTVSATGVNTVTTKTLNPSEAYITSVTLYDGLLRQVQTQAQSISGETSGRLITDTLYDSRGKVADKNTGWFATGAPSTTIAVPGSSVAGRTRYVYDGAGRVTAEITEVHDAEVWRTTTTYDGDRVSVDPPAGGVPQTTITDARGNLVQLWQYTGPAPTGEHTTTSYAYDDAGRLTGVTDPAGNTWTFGYDVRGRQISATDPDKGSSQQTYDDAGQLLTTTDARGQVLAYVYDNLGRKTEQREGSATGSLRASWAYDTLAKGQLDQSVRHTTEGEYVTKVTGYDDGYRPLGQQVTLPASLGTLSGPYTTSYLYAANGQQRGVVLPAAGGLAQETVTTRFDALGRPISSGGGLGWGGYVSSTVYSPFGEVLLYDVGNTYATYLQYTYAPGTRRLLTSTVQREGVTGLDLNLTYTYDDAGNPLSAVDAPAGQPVNAQCYGYDGLRRLTQAWTPADGDCAAAPTVAGLGGPRPYWFTDSFDAIGNRTSRVTHASGGDVTSTYAYPASGAGSVRPHALLGVTASGPGAPPAASFGYDAAGNTLTRDPADGGPQGLTWDVEGELTRVFEGSSTVGEYVYTADGDRLVRREGGVTTVYLPGGQEVSRVDATGQVSALRYYTFNGKTIAVRSGSGYAGVTSMVSDPHATAEIAIDNGTNELTRRYLDPYGNDQGATGEWVGDHGFLNKPVDATGLVAIGARYYDPGIGRFISVDPVMTLTDPQQWAAYSYANNNPITYWDPTGLWPDWLDDAASTVTDAVSTAWDNTTDAVSSAWNATAEWAHDHPGIVQGLGVIAAGVCMAATVGTCLAVGVVALGASTASNYSEMRSGDISTGEFWGRFAVDLAFTALPAVRPLRVASHVDDARGVGRGPLGTFTNPFRGQHAAWTVSGQLRSAIRPTVRAWRADPVRASIRTGALALSGYRSAAGLYLPSSWYPAGRGRSATGSGSSQRMHAY